MLLFKTGVYLLTDGMLREKLALNAKNFAILLLARFKRLQLSGQPVCEIASAHLILCRFVWAKKAHQVGVSGLIELPYLCVVLVVAEKASILLYGQVAPQ